MRRLLRHLRSLFRLQPGRPAVVLGIRAALAVTVPYALASLLGLRDPGWTGLTGLLVTLADPGGSYSTRAQVMGAVAVFGALAGTVAAPAGAAPWVDALLLFAGVFATCFLRSFGETAGSVGSQLAVIFVASLGARAVGWGAALERGGVLLLGGVWAMTQGLLLWPTHPFLPARKAIARVYRAMSIGAEELAALSRGGADPDTWSDAVRRHASIRQSIEDARATLAATRLGRPDEPRRGEHLLVLLELSEPMVAILMALAHAMEIAESKERLDPVRAQVAQVSDRCAEISGTVAQIARDPVKAAAESQVSPHHSALVVPAAALEGLPVSVAELLSRLRDHARAAYAAALAMQRGDPIPVPSRILTVVPEQRGPKRWIEPLREGFAPESLVLRHALRSGLIAAASLIVARSLGLVETHWVVLAAIGILQPYSASTEERAIHRVLGTLGGAMVAVAIAAEVAIPAARLAVIGVLTAVSVSLLPLNFGAFQVLLTPDFLLLASLNAGDWTIAENRAEGVVIACVLALAAAWWLWPSPERHRFPEAAASVLRANGHYFREMATRRDAAVPEVRWARREVGLALLGAEASFERLLAEYQGPVQHLEPAMVLISYSRRLTAAVTALGEQRPEQVTSFGLEHVAEQTGGALDALADSLQEGRPPPPLPAIPLRRASEDLLANELMERVPRQLGILHGAVEKLALEREVVPA